MVNLYCDPFFEKVGDLYIKPDIDQPSTDFFVEVKRFKIFDENDCEKANYEYLHLLTTQIQQCKYL